MKHTGMLPARMATGSPTTEVISIALSSEFMNTEHASPSGPWHALWDDLGGLFSVSRGAIVCPIAHCPCLSARLCGYLTFPAQGAETQCCCWCRGAPGSEPGLWAAAGTRQQQCRTPVELHPSLQDARRSRASRHVQLVCRLLAACHAAGYHGLDWMPQTYCM